MEDNLKKEVEEAKVEIKTEDKIKKIEEEILEIEIKLEENQKELDNAEASVKSARKKLNIRLKNKEFLNLKKDSKKYELLQLKYPHLEENNIIQG